MERSRLSVYQSKANGAAIIGNTFKTTAQKLVVNFGRFTAGDVALEEVSINNEVLRVKLDDVSKLIQKTSLTSDFNRKVSRFGRVIKKKPIMENFEDSGILNMETETASHKPLQINPQQIKEKINNRLKSRNYETEKAEYMSNIKITSVSAIKKKKLPLLPANKLRNSISYYLSIPEDKPPQEGKLKYDFNKLMRDLKTMKLPAPEWRIKIIKKKESITGIVFTDKKELERCVNFSLRCDYYKVLINSKPVLLLGAPVTIDSVSDLELLLDIVQNISSTDQMLMYT